MMSTSYADMQYGWGEGCFYTPNRGGICAFRMKHFLALHAFAEYTVSRLHLIQKSVVIGNIHADKDGAVADSISTASIEMLKSQGVKASKCRFPINSNCKLSNVTHADNLCAAPHSLFSVSEAESHAPFSQYWKTSLFANIADFINGDIDVIGSKDPAYQKDASICSFTNTTMGLGPMFDAIGPAYLKSARSRYKSLRRDK